MEKYSVEHERTLTIEIRPLTTEDTASVRSMHAESWRDTYENDTYGVTREWLVARTTQWLTPDALQKSEKLFQAIIDDPSQFYRVAEVQGKPVGFIHSAMISNHKHLAALYLDKSQHGRGLAQDLMKLFDEWAEGYDVDLEVACYNYRAIRFYEKCGFQIMPESGALFADKIPTVTMIRRGKV